MKLCWILAIQLSFFVWAPQTLSQALTETTALLNDPVAREKAAAGDPAAQQALQQVSNLGLNSAGEAKIFELSGKILEKLSVDSDGDSSKLDQRVQSLIRDPASLESVINADQRTQIHDLANETQVNLPKSIVK